MTLDKQFNLIVNSKGEIPLILPCYARSANIVLEFLKTEENIAEVNVPVDQKRDSLYGKLNRYLHMHPELETDIALRGEKLYLYRRDMSKAHEEYIKKIAGDSNYKEGFIQGLMAVKKKQQHE
ncbi:MAG: hypothetical protein M0R80_09780 [Proteobacteria bacterium]|jgi:hypothetical protein|nr:hypothetical protein [Pseudomonadota bacterium]